MSRLWIDHVIYAVDDLDTAGAALFDREGLASVPGGRHAGWGTENRIVPLGKSYLELIAVVDVDEAEGSEFGRPVRRALTEDHPMVGWVVATDDIDAVAKRLDLEVEEKSREAADGSTLSWRLAGLERAMKTGALPFFVQWDVPPERHPGAAEVTHEADVRGIAWVEVSADDQDAVRSGSATTPTSRFGSPRATGGWPRRRSRRAAARSSSAARPAAPPRSRPSGRTGGARAEP